MSSSDPPPAQRRTERSKHLKLRQIEVFLEAARYENFGTASKKLGVSSAYISEVIGDLEEDLGGGVVLFERDKRGALLTPQGRALLPHGQRLLDDAEAARQAVAGANLKGSRVRIAYQPVLASAARAAIASLMRRQPGLVVEAIEVPSADIHLHLEGEKRDVDVALAYLPETPNDPANKVRTPNVQFHREVLAASDLWLIVSDRHALAQPQGEVALKELRDVPFAVPWIERKDEEPSWVRKTVEAYFGKQRFQPVIVFSSNRVSAVQAIVRAGVAVTVLPTLDPHEREGLVMRRLDPKPRKLHTIGLLRRNDHKFSPAEEAFAAEVRSHLQSGGMTDAE
jgi:LysR family cyn operon transcriptional activator